MVNHTLFLAFADEMQKIANLRKYVTTAEGGRYVEALMGLAGDSKAKQEAFQRFNQLKRSGGLPESLRSAPVPDAFPSGFLANARAQANLLSWLNKNKANPGFKSDAKQALRAAMEQKLSS